MNTTLAHATQAAAPPRGPIPAAATQPDPAAETRADVPDGAVHGDVHRLLRLEGAVVLVASVLAYRALGGGWVLFAALFLAPDIGMIGYLRGPRLGAWTYNALHTYAAPALLALIALAAPLPGATAVALIWTAHIAFDRLAGYGLKYPTAFGATHLGRRGR